jgi:hypothetical protein
MSFFTNKAIVVITSRIDHILKAFRFLENLADLFFLLLRHKFSSIAYVRVVNFNAEKRKKKEQKIRKPRCFEYMDIVD